MRQSSLRRDWVFPAAILLAAVFVSGLLASSAGALPGSGLATTPTPPRANGSTPGALTGGGTANPGGGTANPGGGTADPNTGPLAPGLSALQATAHSVTVGWFDRSTDEQKFVLYRRDAQGTFEKIYEVPTRNVAGDSGSFSYVDTGTSLSGQCYDVAAVNQFGVSYTQEECTVRPDPNSFPQTVPAAAKQWSGLTNVNNGIGDLYSQVKGSRLREYHQTFGVNLDFLPPKATGGAVWTVKALGGPHLMKGQAVALRVSGGGWLHYGHQTWGINLRFLDSPSYEWYVLGGTPGHDLTPGPFALWNAVHGDYLVVHHRTFGVDLDWYKSTIPSPPPPPPAPAQGVKTYIAYNCISEQRPLEMWVEDLTAGTPFVDEGRLDSQWFDSHCPGTGQPWTFTPTSGHGYLIRAVDYSDPFFDCSNDPLLGACWAAQRTFVGDANGIVVNDTLG
jgi:hypothetical protein